MKSECKKVESMLYNYNKTKVEIKNMKLNLEILEDDYNGVGSIVYKDGSKGTSGFHSEVENEVIKREEKIMNFKSKIRLKEIEIQKIDNVIELLDDRDRYIITEYYINDNQLKNISRHINLEENYLSAYKGNLIKKIAKILFIED